MRYVWVPVTVERYWTASESVPPPVPRAILNWYTKGSVVLEYGAYNYALSYTQHIGAALEDIVPSVVQDFREAVGAALYDEAKDDNTLVPQGCLIHIDAIVCYEFFRRSDFVKKFDPGAGYMEDTVRAAKKRATIYRRELGAYLKKELVGDVFPQELPPTAPAIPFYTTERPANKRSL